MPLSPPARACHRTLVPALLVVVAAILGACSDDPRTDTAGSEGRPNVCVDADGDGFGSGCPLGADCNDGDSSITNGCYRCESRAPGCPCPHESERVPCGKVSRYFPELDKTICGEGGQVCTNGTWSTCELGAYAPGHNGVR